MGISDDWSTPLVILVIVVLVAMFAVAAFFFVRLLRTFRIVHSQFMPLGGKLAFWAALAYLVLPIDVLPDPLLLDDIALLAGALTYINRLARGLDPADGDEPDDGRGEIIDIPQ